jgi:hypothetical protein
MDELMVHNPGVRSRFPTVILFADYNAGELMAIAAGILKKQHLTATAGGLAALEAKLQAMVDAPDVQVRPSVMQRNGVWQNKRRKPFAFSSLRLLTF